MVEVGGVPYVCHKIDEFHQKKIYSMSNVLNICHPNYKTDHKNKLIFGAAAASSKLFPKNAELIPNLNINTNGNVICNNTRYAEIDDYHNPIIGRFI